MNTLLWLSYKIVGGIPPITMSYIFCIHNCGSDNTFFKFEYFQMLRIYDIHVVMESGNVANYYTEYYLDRCCAP